MRKAVLLFAALLAGCSASAGKHGKWSVRDHIVYVCGHVADVRFPLLRGIVITCSDTIVSSFDAPVMAAAAKKKHKQGLLAFVRLQKDDIENVLLTGGYFHVEPPIDDSCYYWKDENPKHAIPCPSYHPQGVNT